MNRFFVYEEYGAKYELMIKDVASTYRTIPQWEIYQKGLEALAATLASINSKVDRNKKSLTIGDLLVKVRRWTKQFDDLLSRVAYTTSLQISPLIRSITQADTGM